MLNQMHPGNDALLVFRWISVKRESHMDRVSELINVLEDEDVRARDAIAKAHRTCKICEKPAVFFYTAQAEVEYQRSLICQSCQDYFLTEGTGISVRRWVPGGRLK